MVGLAEIEEAVGRIAGRAHRTPVLRSRYFDARVGAELYFKCENLQRVGAFKFRGACNAVFALSSGAARRGVLTHSSGNHAQALALAARERGIPALIVMPRTAPEVKVEAVRGYGAELHFCEPTLEAREARCAELQRTTGASLIHPYDNDLVIAGQASAAKELLEEAPPLDCVFAPVGGGGLLSGTALACHYYSPGTEVHAGEPSGADDAKRSLEAGHLIPSVDPCTVADGLLTSLAPRTFAILREHVKAIHAVDDEATLAAMRDVWQRMKLVIEPSAAVPLAAVLALRDSLRGKRIGVIFSGGNVDFPNPTNEAQGPG